MNSRRTPVKNISGLLKQSQSPESVIDEAKSQDEEDLSKVPISLIYV